MPSSIQAVLADALVVVHLGFIVFAMFGGLLGLRWRWMPWVHLPAALWSAAVALLGWICPLTPMENALRRAAGGPGYTGDFVDRYLAPVVYPSGLTREIQIGLGVGVLLLNLAIYMVVWRRRRVTRREAPPA